MVGYGLIYMCGSVKFNSYPCINPKDRMDLWSNEVFAKESK